MMCKAPHVRFQISASLTATLPRNSRQSAGYLFRLTLESSLQAVHLKPPTQDRQLLRAQLGPDLHLHSPSSPQQTSLGKAAGGQACIAQCLDSSWAMQPTLWKPSSTALVSHSFGLVLRLRQVAEVYSQLSGQRLLRIPGQSLRPRVAADAFLQEQHASDHEAQHLVWLSIWPEIARYRPCSQPSCCALNAVVTSRCEAFLSAEAQADSCSSQDRDSAGCL